ncbi:MAG TPA: lamin tail domain-containing protein [Candidatus Nanoarchaeia archaeon]|nr:lamin tail domain-containing protein [Candidatus Nanoarchaeia archaeon]
MGIKKENISAVLISFVLIISFILSLSLISAVVFINEAEVNPFGSDNGNEWIELYNNGNAVNITGWYINDIEGNNYTISGVIIEEDGFYVLDSLSGLVNNQSLSLFRDNNLLHDSTGNFLDSDNDDLTFSRNPDGSGDFVFQNSTKGFSNQPVTISDTNSSSCNIKGKNVILSSVVEGFCVEDVIFSVESDNGWVNFSGNTINGKNYSALINSTAINISQNTNWQLFVRDCFNQTFSSQVENFYLNENTLLIVNPSEPDGNNEWYITTPEFSLFNFDALQIFYKWDNGQTINYTLPFHLENVPNNGSISAGSLELNYWSELSCITEQKVSKELMIDLKDPEIEDVLPENNSILFDTTPFIYAYVDEVYQGNSGVDNSSAVLKIDDIEVNEIVKKSGTLDVKVEYTPGNNLSYGNHTIELYIEDKAGRNSTLVWSFQIVEPYLNITINSPVSTNYNERRIPINISVEGEEALLQYINYNDRVPRWKRLCTTCSEYGDSRKKAIFFNEGWNNITVQAVGKLSGGIVEENIVFFIDSVAPRVSSTYPSNNKLTNGSLFKVKYSENNLDNISLVINGNEVIRDDCMSGRNQECNFSVNFSEFNINDSQAAYYFELRDLLHSIRSRLVRVYIDDTIPVITVNLPENITYIDRRIPINITVSESVRLEYKDITEIRPVTRRLCSNCGEYGNVRGKTSIFKSGYHELEVKATDRAGNSASTIVAFSVA